MTSWAKKKKKKNLPLIDILVNVNLWDFFFFTCFITTYGENLYFLIYLLFYCYNINVTGFFFLVETMVMIGTLIMMSVDLLSNHDYLTLEFGFRLRAGFVLSSL